jgi:hypothetical protein
MHQRIKVGVVHLGRNAEAGVTEMKFVSKPESRTSGIVMRFVNDKRASWNTKVK